ncbi:MAG: PGF-CTERM sorting domain-containing protein [Methanocorpusculum parvum]|nr:PGF-CTERM sorting domain-containing protein [Methanocorpusculum parvum]
MNAKKIMGAVLVALLAVTAFAGAGAAADTLDLGSVPAYTAFSNVQLNGVVLAGDYAAADGSVITTYGTGTAAYFAENEEAYGKVYTGTATSSSGVVSVKFILVAPTAPVTALSGGISIIGQTVTVGIAQGAVYTVGGLYSSTSVVFIDEDGVIYTGPNSGSPATNFPFTAGKWGVAANLTGATGVSGVQIIGLPYYFTVSETDAIISSVKDTVNIGQSIVINVLVPGATYVDVFFDGKVEYDETKPQAGVTYNTGDDFVTVALGIDGRGSVAFKANIDGETTFTLDTTQYEDAEVTVTIAKGVITAAADEDSFFVGNPIYLSGTSTAGKGLNFYIEGQNFLFTKINVPAGDIEWNGENWNVKIDAAGIKDANGKTLIAGTYPVIVSLANEPTISATTTALAAGVKETVMGSTYATAAITLTQPFITGVEAPAVVVQGDIYKITGTAYAAKNVKLYVFGTNYFAFQPTTTDKNEQFEFDLLSAGITKDMAVGTYFYLIQHPMKDTLFNVWTNESAVLGETTFGDFYYAATEDATRPVGANAGNNALDNFVFNAFKRGTNFAAQALLEEIAGQNIDDIFVQGTFEVEAKKVEINPIPAEVAKGTALTVTGYTNSGEGVEVIVNVLSGKFGATVKGDENAALFLTEKAVTKEDGTFEAKIDTSKLELGSYIVTVELDGNQYDTAAVAIVAASEPVTPPADDEPVTPPADDEPVVPETPGFGALAALAGLGAVAVLLLRRE